MIQFDEPTDVNLVEDIRSKRRGRMYIPHGRGEEKPYKPHIQHIDVSYTECGPDKTSKLRRLSSPASGDHPKESLFYPPLMSLRHFPDKANVSSGKEFTFYPPHGTPIVYNNGKITFFNGIHRASRTTTKEITDIIQFGHRGPVYDTRDGYPSAAHGDKPYKTPEYSPNFHKLGSTRPVVDFGGFKPEVADTFIPLQPLPLIPAKPFSILNAERKKKEEVGDVKSLNEWRPASPLVVPTTDWR